MHCARLCDCVGVQATETVLYHRAQPDDQDAIKCDKITIFRSLVGLGFNLFLGGACS